MNLVTLEILAVALIGFSWVYWIYRRGVAKKQFNVTQLPTHWELRLRPVFSEGDRSVWLWLQDVFPEHVVLIKVPVIRFLSGTADDLKRMIRLKDIYCSFTVCSSKGKVIGCIDVPGAKGLSASRYDFKKKLFDDCALPYALLGASKLPTRESLRAVFLKETGPLTPSASRFEASRASQVSDFPVTEAPITETPVGIESEQAVGLDSVANVRNNLHIKLDGNRKIRQMAVDSLKNNVGLVDDKTSGGVAPRWDDSFIMGEGSSPSVH